MSSDEFAPYFKKYGCFIALNISHLNQDHGPERKKVVRVFHYPINPGQTRDILAIPGVGEADIRASLLKGELRHKILAQDIIITCSDIDLLQFNPDQKIFLQQAGIVNGLEIVVTPGNLNYAWREKIPLIGLRNGINRIFFTPDKFINGAYFGNIFHITIEHNGKELYEGIDYTIAESGGAGTGYDTLNIFALTPNSHSLLYATYAIKI
jgi:hypothetical protein